MRSGKTMGSGVFSDGFFFFSFFAEVLIVFDVSRSIVRESFIGMRAKRYLDLKRNFVKVIRFLLSS